MLAAARVYIPPLVYLELANPPFVITGWAIYLYSPSTFDPATDVGTEDSTMMSEESSDINVTEDAEVNSDPDCPDCPDILLTKELKKL